MTELELKKKNVETVQRQKPTYTDKYAQQVTDAANAYTNRGAFSYNPESDSTYKAYRSQYVRQGQQAMRDSMAQASGLTGGYGSTYAQSAGQQGYDSYLQKLNEMLPDLYKSARSAYDAEGENLYNQYKAMLDLQGNDRSAYDMRYAKWEKELAAAKADEEALYSREYAEKNDAYTRIANAIAQTGYIPDQAALDAAGMTYKEAAAWYAVWAAENLVTSGSKKSSGSKTTVDRSKYPALSYGKTGSMTYEELRKYADDLMNKYT